MIKVLDKGWIELWDVMGSDLTVVNAARTSYLGEMRTPTEDYKLLEYLIKNKHDSPLEFVQYHFRIHAPVMVIIQWLRHRMSSTNAQSGRYVEYPENDFYTPTVWRKQSATNKQGSDGVVDELAGEKLTNALKEHQSTSYSLYKAALNAGVAKEQARLFLPAYGNYMTFVWSSNLRNLLHFLGLRCDEHAQEEIRLYAYAIREIVKEHNPKVYEYYMKHRST